MYVVCKVWRSENRSFLSSSRSLSVYGEVGGTRCDGNADETRLTGIERLTTRISSMNHRTRLAKIAVSQEKRKGGARFCGTIRNEHARVTAPTYNLRTRGSSHFFPRSRSSPSLWFSAPVLRLKEDHQEMWEEERNNSTKLKNRVPRSIHYSGHRSSSM